MGINQRSTQKVEYVLYCSGVHLYTICKLQRTIGKVRPMVSLCTSSLKIRAYVRWSPCVLIRAKYYIFGPLNLYQLILQLCHYLIFFVIFVFKCFFELFNRNCILEGKIAKSWNKANFEKTQRIQLSLTKSRKG